MVSNNCKSAHRFDTKFAHLLPTQAGAGRHRCAGCAYEMGRAAGLARAEVFVVDFTGLPESQAGTVRHKSPHEAWALGYRDGIRQSYVMGPTQARLS
jgi:hypothetical protein